MHPDFSLILQNTIEPLIAVVPASRGIRHNGLSTTFSCGLPEGPVRAVHAAFGSGQSQKSIITVSPQRHLNPRMHFNPVPPRRNPSKSARRRRKTTIRLFDFKGLWAKLLN